MTALTLEFFCDWVSAENLGGTSRSPAATTPRRHLHVRYPFSLGIKSRFARSYHRGKDMPELLAAIGRQPAHQSLNWACWKGGQSMFKLGEAGMMRNSNPEYTALRRTFLKGSLAAGAAVAGTNSLTPGAAVAGGRLEEPHQPSAAGLIIRQKEPNNLEMPFDLLESYLTPTELFYIRNHFPPPSIDPAGYRLSIDGAVSKPSALSYRELRDLPSETRIARAERLPM
jgi:hypothetical protein